MVVVPPVLEEEAIFSAELKVMYEDSHHVMLLRGNCAFFKVVSDQMFDFGKFPAGVEVHQCIEITNVGNKEANFCAEVQPPRLRDIISAKFLKSKK